MTTTEMTVLGFLFLASLFTFSMLRSLIKLFSDTAEENESLGPKLLSIFSIPLISFVLLMIFVFVFMIKR